MSLPPVQLDDLTFAAMVDAIRRRIPAESDGRWTLHAPVDPGITLLELYAALLEQRLYWMDHVPDAFVGAALRLLGLDPPRPAVPAGTVLVVSVAAGATPPSGAPQVDAGTAFARDPTGAGVCTLDQSITLLPVTAVTLHAGGVDRTADLAAGHGVALLPGDGEPGEARIAFATATTDVPPPDAWISLLLDVDAYGVPPQWSPDAVADVPPPATLQWCYDDGGTRTPFPADDIDDGTQGLRRAGVVRLRYPDAWRTRPTTTLVLTVATEAATFTAPPVLRHLEVNAAIARQRATMGWRAGTPATMAPTSEQLDDLVRQLTGWLPLPGQHLDLPDTADQLITAHLELHAPDGSPQTWTATPDLTFHDRTDTVFVVDRGVGALRFGDGRTGRIPVVDRTDPLAAIDWTTGGGAAANGGITRNWRAVEQPSLAAANPVPVDGGRDAETIPQARARAAAALAEPSRAVTVVDHVEIATTTPGVPVARAYALVGAHPGYPCTAVPGAVTVRVVPAAPRPERPDDDAWIRPDLVVAPRPDPGLMRAVRARLDDARLIGAELFLAAPRYRRTWLRVDLAGAPPRDEFAVRNRIRVGLRRFLDPLLGGGDGDGYPFGESLRPSALVRVAQRAAGIDADVVAVAIRTGDDTWESCKDVPLRADELVELFDARVRFRADAGGPVVGEGGLA